MAGSAIAGRMALGFLIQKFSKSPASGNTLRPAVPAKASAGGAGA